ncbi:hypothetical protein C8F04DRAFT_1271632 [Mycena alexandri]|uniref:Uncharacterized protein n=1 Tax=Mycena alexandri TaxID=1745969 RepID=A0AAD6WSC7_9AGAR|nr:hypothetical protein C8F04DRAFT_1271632 [Mycena alexandri]
MALYPQKTQSHATRTLSRVPTFVDMQAHDQTLLPDRPTKDSMTGHSADVSAHMQTKLLLAEATWETMTVNVSTDMEAEATDDEEVPMVRTLRDPTIARMVTYRKYFNFKMFKELLTFWQLKVESSVLLSRERILRKFVGRRLVTINDTDLDSETF